MLPGRRLACARGGLGDMPVLTSMVAVTQTSTSQSCMHTHTPGEGGELGARSAVPFSFLGDSVLPALFLQLPVNVSLLQNKKLKKISPLIILKGSDSLFFISFFSFF